MMYKRLFSFNRAHIIPCNLHCVMAITRKLFELLAREIEGHPTLEEEFVKALLEECQIKIKSAQKTKPETLFTRIQHSRLNRTAYLRLLEKYSVFMNLLRRYAGDKEQQNKIEAITPVWYGFAALVSVLTQPEVQITEHEWCIQARTWGINFTKCYCEEDVTPYMHVLIYHIGFYLAKYKSVERYANYAIEGKHQENKHTFAQASSGFSRGEKSAAQQQLQGDLRFVIHSRTFNKSNDNIQRPTKRQKENWSTKTLALYPEMQQYVPKNNNEENE